MVADMAEDKIDMEIGGTLQQRISSCLTELDALLTTETEPVVYDTLSFFFQLATLFRLDEN